MATECYKITLRGPHAESFDVFSSSPDSQLDDNRRGGTGMPPLRSRSAPA